MRYMSLFASDLHVHTNLSFCAPRSTEPASYLPLFDSEQVKAVGFVNHVYYPEDLPRLHTSYSTGATHVASIRPAIDALQKQTEVRLLMGCEAETIAHKGPSLSQEEAAPFDYILLAPSHVLNLTRHYEGVDYSTPDKLRELTVAQFKAACLLQYGKPTGICHPLYPICSPEEQQIVDGITDEVLGDCFTLAKEQGKAIEIHACLYRSGTERNAEGLSPSYLRMLRVAKECGCRFFFGSDAHAPEQFEGRHRLLLRAAELIGVGEEDLWEILHI